MNLNLLHHKSLNFTLNFLFFDGAGSELSAIFFCNVSIFFTVPILLGNNRKIGLKDTMKVYFCYLNVVIDYTLSRFFYLF